MRAKIKEIIGEIPPKTHISDTSQNLGNLESDENIFKLSDVSVVTRYPEDFEELQRTYETQNDMTVRDLGKRNEIRNPSDIYVLYEMMSL